jgi:hypothetical protein
MKTFRLFVTAISVAGLAACADGLPTGLDNSSAVLDGGTVGSDGRVNGGTVGSDGRVNGGTVGSDGRVG